SILISIDMTRKAYEATESVIQQILTSKGQVDLFSEMKDAKAACRLYIICFVGVNGVGKSTNLSKLCFWLLQKQFKVLIAACDTFRSGAVEQLRVHVQNLNNLGVGLVELFERGYGKDAATIAKEAIRYGWSLKLNEISSFYFILVSQAESIRCCIDRYCGAHAK
ncbi:MAG: hypothetical protein ACREF7_03050, partial [Candidatus Saccharimonadales bacterium]